MSWTDARRVLFFKGICEHPPLDETLDESAEAIRTILNGTLKRFQKKFTKADISNEIQRVYNLEPSSEKDKTSEHAGEVDQTEKSHRTESTESDLSPECGPLRTRGGRRRKRTQDDEISASPEAEEEDQQLLSTEEETNKNEDNVNTYEATGDEIPKEEMNEIHSGDDAQNSDNGEKDEDTKNIADTENIEKGGNVSEGEIDDNETGGEEHEPDVAAPENVPENEANETDNPRARRASRAARPSMTRDSLSPQRRTRASASARAKAEDSSTRAKGNNLKRNKTEAKNEISDSETEDSPPSKRRAARRQAGSAAAASSSSSATTTKKPVGRRKAESTVTTARNSKKSTASEPKPTRKAATATKTAAAKGASKGRPATRRAR